MQPEIHLICLTQEIEPLFSWPLGQVVAVEPTPQAIAAWLKKTAPANRLDEWWLFWDLSLGNPDTTTITSLCHLTGDVYHAGLCLGLSDWPRLHDFVNPTWPLNRDPDPLIEATSWRMSLRACLVRGTVLAQLGGPDPGFTTLSGASLELGHRWITQGAFMRHIPGLVMASKPPLATCPTLTDEFGFIYRRCGWMWTIWALYRTLAHGYRWLSVWSAFRQVWGWTATHPVFSLSRQPLSIDTTIALPTVSVLIPTLNRYPYLFRLLDQLRQQTISPLEIIVVDQTEKANRQPEWPQQFNDLPLRIIWRDEPGQCSSRNAALQVAQGDCILLFDDDIEIPKDLIAVHLELLVHYQVDASCGTVEEVGANKVVPEMSFIQTSSIFPAGNTLVRREALSASGLFDMAYDKGARADGDLGMRLYLAGKQLLLNPSARILHLHAPKGGLRQHKARIITRASSRDQLWQRHLVAPTEGYLWGRYFSAKQCHEALWIRTFATLRHDGTRWQKIVRFLIMFLMLPFTYYQNQQRLQQGRQLNQYHPTIPTLTPKGNV